MEKRKIKVAISHGDINGANYELLLKCFANASILELFTPIVYGSQKAYEFWREKLKFENAQWHICKSPRDISLTAVNLINCDEGEVSVEVGQPTDLAGRLAYIALERAVRDVLNKEADVLVTAPINKATMPQDVFPYKGHTKYLEVMSAEQEGKSLMLLTARDCRVALATEHLPIKEVSQALTIETIVDKVRTLDAGLKQDFTINKPRIAMLSLNPHAGDAGLLGDEEETIIRPAMKQLKEEGILCYGPYPADGYFSTDLLDTFDAVLAMYHDQGLAPFKAMYMNEGVNCTLGLKIIRTSPDHGTAYDIAGKGVADPTSLKESIYLAIDMYRARRNDRYARRNPLRNTYRIRGRDDERIDLTKDYYDSY